MIKLLIGGSPCTFWSIAQKNNRETTASGIGWELFKNYLIAKDKFKPDFFLYENNVSAAWEIKQQIKKELDVYDGTFLMTDSGNRYIEINSALVSAQTRQRFYVHNCGDVDLPADRGIMLADILESGAADKEKAYCLRSVAGNTRDYFKKHHTQLVFEPVILSNPHGFNKGGAKYGKAPTLTATGKYIYNNQVLEPVRVGELPAANGEPSQSQACRIYGVTGKSVTLSAGGGGYGGKTGLYAVPCGTSKGGKARTLTAGYQTASHRDFVCDITTNGHLGKTGVLSPVNVTATGKAQTIKANYRFTSVQNICCYKSTYGATGVAIPADESDYIERKEQSAINKVYKVTAGRIYIKGKQYEIDLPDGYYLIRKLTVAECCRLQTLPDDYCRAVSDSQAYKGLGNGWTAEVIIHILRHAFDRIPKDEKIKVLSMYDGIATGRYCLEKLGFKNVEYHAYEIDKYAMTVALSNYPDIIQHGDAFQVRADEWEI